MRFNYLVYQKARQKLEDGGLIDKIKKVHDGEDGLPFITHTGDNVVAQAVREMQRGGFFETLEKKERTAFQSGLQKAFKEKHPWKIHRNERITESPPESEDFYILTGWLGSFVLKPEELWDFKRFGFDSLNDFVGSFGAAVWTFTRRDYRRGYQWTTETPDGRALKNDIGGDLNLDLRIHQTDITPYKTFDPSGFQVSYRPEFDEDVRCAAAYHSTEPEFLIGVLKWIHQQNIQSEMLRDNGQPLIEWTRSLGHAIGAATECFNVSWGACTPRILLMNFYEPIPVLDKDYSTERRSFDGLVMEGGKNCFGMYIGQNKELIFAHEGIGGKTNQKNPRIVFQPSESDHLLKGICYQSARGLGRTSPQRILALIEYRFSEQMDKDIKEINERVVRGFPKNK